MKKIFRARKYAVFNETIRAFLMHETKIVYREETDMRNDGTTICDFYSLCEYLIERGQSFDIKVHRTMFGNFVIYYLDSEEYEYKRITKRNFKSFRQELDLEEVTNCTFDQFMKSLKADEFVEYCKDNGMSICPVDKGASL